MLKKAGLRIPKKNTSFHYFKSPISHNNRNPAVKKIALKKRQCKFTSARKLDFRIFTYSFVFLRILSYSFVFLRIFSYSADKTIKNPSERGEKIGF